MPCMPLHRGGLIPNFNPGLQPPNARSPELYAECHAECDRRAAPVPKARDAVRQARVVPEKTKTEPAKEPTPTTTAGRESGGWLHSIEQRSRVARFRRASPEDS